MRKKKEEKKERRKIKGPRKGRKECDLFSLPRLPGYMLTNKPRLDCTVSLLAPLLMVDTLSPRPGNSSIP
jgi:hypothetical protein